MLLSPPRWDPENSTVRKPDRERVSKGHRGPWDSDPLTAAGGALRGSQWRTAAAPGQPTPPHTRPESRGRDPATMNETDSEDSDPEAETTGVGGHHLTKQVCRGREIFHSTRDISQRPCFSHERAHIFEATTPHRPKIHPDWAGRMHPGIRACWPTMLGRWWGMSSLSETEDG